MKFSINFAAYKTRRRLKKEQRIFEMDLIKKLQKINDARILFEEIRGNEELTMLVLKNPELRKKLGKYNQNVLNQIESQTPSMHNTGDYKSIHGGKYLLALCENYNRARAYIVENHWELLHPNDLKVLIEKD
jgi:hypothetical protein